MRSPRLNQRLLLASLFAGVAALLLVAACGNSGDGNGENGLFEGSPTATIPPQDMGVPGVSDDTVLFGQSAAFEGPAQELGINMRLGIEAAFAEANANGGVHGRRLELVSYNDSYEPEASIANTVRLIEEDNVFALIGEVGTPTSRSATPIASLAGVPFIGPFTGAGFLRDPAWQNIINLRSSYQQETAEMVARLMEDLGITRIGVMYQDDSYGRSGYRGVLAALEPHGMEPVAVGLYQRNTTAVKTALLDLMEGEPEAVIMIGAYEPCAQLILWGRHLGLDAMYLNVSFVGSNALQQELGSDGAGVIVTQVVPFPWDSSLPVVASYQGALEAYQPGTSPGFVSLEGYLAGRMAIAGLEMCGADVDRQCFVDSILGSEMIDLEGFELRFGPEDNQGSDKVFLTVIGSDGAYHAVDTLSEAREWSNY